MAVLVDYTPYGENDGETSVSAPQTPPPSVQSDTGVPNTRQRFHAAMGAFSALTRRSNALVPFIAGIPEELEVLRTIAPALNNVALAIKGRDEVVEDVEGVPTITQYFQPGLLDYISGWAAYEEEGGGTVAADPGLLERSKAFLADVGWAREAVAGVRDEDGNRTGPGIFESVLRTGVETFTGPLNADGTPTTTGDFRVARNALKSVVGVFGQTVAADGTASGTSEITTIRETLQSIDTKMTTIVGEIASLGVDVAGLGGDIAGVEDAIRDHTAAVTAP